MAVDPVHGVDAVLQGRRHGDVVKAILRVEPQAPGQSIDDEARRIRTLAISELPDQDCCTLLTPRRVETRARIDDLRRIEVRLDAEDLAEELAAGAHEYRQSESF